MSAHSTKHTLAYKTIDDVDLTLDLYLPDETKFGHVAALTQQILAQARGGGGAPQTVDGKLPVLVFWHGGGLVAGSKDWLPKWLLNDALDGGFAVVVPNYTLLSPYTGHDTLADVKSLFTWIGAELNGSLAALGGSQLVDTDRVAVAGASAGGLLALLSAIHADPKPKAALSLYGMGGSLLSDFYLHPKTTPWCGEVPFRGYPRQPDPLIEDDAPFRAIQASRDRVLEAEDGDRLPFGDWLLQTATYLDVYAGEEGLSRTLAALPHDERPRALPDSARALIPELHPITEESTPLFLVHGLEDTMVLLEESRAIKRRYDAVGALCELLEVAESEHGFESEFETSERGLEKIVPFLLKHAGSR